MDLGIIILKKSQTEEYKYCMVSFKSRILRKKMVQMNLFTKQKQTQA